MNLQNNVIRFFPGPIITLAVDAIVALPSSQISSLFDRQKFSRMYLSMYLLIVGKLFKITLIVNEHTQCLAVRNKLRDFLLEAVFEVTCQQAS